MKEERKEGRKERMKTEDGRTCPIGSYESVALQDCRTYIYEGKDITEGKTEGYNGGKKRRKGITEERKEGMIQRKE